MAYETVYSPDTSEPFEVHPLKATDLVLNKGWTRTPWTREEVVVEAVEEPARGRGRRRRMIEDAPVEEASSDFEDEVAPAESWRH